MNIQFTDITFVTNNVLRLRAFYEAVFGGKADGDEFHSTLGIDGTYFVFLAQKNPACKRSDKREPLLIEEILKNDQESMPLETIGERSKGNKPEMPI